ncbi:uncharacterized protein EAF02_006539 [Botrytis sinoallii]|uniref:uncharacterized protein n=1 Tax=Botrytis sinoallii TaxID=1463999 RepID=UPI0019021AC3|nr:uncharacterized protein EAF02_006539 [Botrytis sinoallii]KAF7881851.1 hypothetical protein EAF02_006539 [Botrytis sinoallii]
MDTFSFDDRIEKERSTPYTALVSYPTRRTRQQTFETSNRIVRYPLTTSSAKMSHRQYKEEPGNAVNNEHISQVALL